MRPIVTFLTDFGLSDPYVAEMKAAVLARCPTATLVDVSHLIPPQNVLAGAVVLERALRAFPPDTVHVAVVDPGVGTERRLLKCRVRGQFVLLPDNGLITWAERRLGPITAEELVWRHDDVSATFHGRDVLAPAAAMLAAKALHAGATRPADSVRLLDVSPATGPGDAVVLYVDHFGNAVTNVPAGVVNPSWRVNGDIPIARTYGDVAEGRPVALVGSGGLLEIAVRNGNAARFLELRPGDKVSLS